MVKYKLCSFCIHYNHANLSLVLCCFIESLNDTCKQVFMFKFPWSCMWGNWCSVYDTFVCRHMMIGLVALQSCGLVGVQCNVGSSPSVSEYVVMLLSIQWLCFLGKKIAKDPIMKYVWWQKCYGDRMLKTILKTLHAASNNDITLMYLNTLLVDNWW